MAIIGEWAVRLVANASGLVAGCEAGARTVRTFAQQARVATAAIGSGLNSAIAGIARIDLGKSTEQLQKVTGAVLGVGSAVLTGGGVAIAGAVTAATLALVSMASASMDAIALQEKLGQRLGITASEAGGLQVMASRVGLSSDDLSDGLDKYAHRLGKLQEQLNSGRGGPMVDALERLGINARDFIQLSMPEQFALLSDRMKTVSNATERAAVLGGLLGPRLAESFQGMIRQSSADFRDLTGLAQRFGVAVDAATATRIRATVKELKDVGILLGSTVGIVGRTLAVTLAPVAMFVGQTLGTLIEKAQPVLAMLGLGLVIAFAPILAIISLVTAGVRVFMPIIEGVSDVIKDVGEAVGAVFSEVWGVLQSVGQAFAGMVDGQWVGPLDHLKEALQFFGKVAAMTIRGLGMVIADTIALVARGLAWLAGVAAAVMPKGDASSGERSWAQRLTMLQQQLGGVQAKADAAANSLRNLTAPQAAQRSDFSNAVQDAQRRIAMRAFTGQVPVDANAAANAFQGLQQFLLAPPPNAVGGPERVHEITRALDQQIERLNVSAARQAWLDARAAGATEQQLREIEARSALLAVGQAMAANTQRINEIDQQIATRGMSARDLDLHRLELTRNATDEMRQQLNLAHDRLEAVNRTAAAEQQVRQMLQSQLTPLQRFQEGVNDVFNFAERGGMNAEQQARQIGNMFDELDRAFPQHEREAPGALLEGSVEAARAVAAARRDAMSRTVDPQARMVELMEQQRDRDRRREERDRQLLALAQNGFFEVVN